MSVCACVSVDVWRAYVSMCPVICEEAMAVAVLVMSQYQFTPRPDGLPLPPLC